MNKEEIIKEFVNSDTFEIIEDYISKPYIETINELENNWNELKEYILEDSWSSVNGEITSKLILNKMQEIESRK